jgi:biopolymer transport protein TolQ
MSMLSLVLNASIPVQFIMLLLIVISIASWTFIFAKRSAIKKALTQTRRFEDDFWSGGDLALLHQSISTRRAEQGALARIFDSGMTEFLKGRRAGASAESTASLDGARRAMRAAFQREMDELESHLNFLASAGSVSPYIGLLGTPLSPRALPRP